MESLFLVSVGRLSGLDDQGVLGARLVRRLALAVAKWGVEPAVAARHIGPRPVLGAAPVEDNGPAGRPRRGCGTAMPTAACGHVSTSPRGGQREILASPPCVP